jgi:tyrosyl-tRNA synthetase
VTKADGSKFGKTEQGNVWLDARLTSPYAFYQFWLNASDEDAEKYIRIFTFLNQDECESLITQHREQPHMRMLQKRLGQEVTELVHGKSEYEAAIGATEILFGNGTSEQLASMSETLLLQVFEGVPQFTISRSDIEAGIPIIELLATSTQIMPSKGEARKMIEQNAISINKSKFADSSGMVKLDSLIRDKYMLVQKGKKNYYLVIVS